MLFHKSNAISSNAILSQKNLTFFILYESSIPKQYNSFIKDKETKLSGITSLKLNLIISHCGFVVSRHGTLGAYVGGSSYNEWAVIFYWVGYYRKWVCYYPKWMGNHFKSVGFGLLS